MNTSPPNPSDVDTKSVIESLFRNLADIGVSIERSHTSHREAFKNAEPQASCDLRCCVDGLIALIYNSVSEPIENISEESQYQICVAASFIKTHLLLNDLILDGSLIESYVLLRKQLEGLARLEELNSKPLSKLEGKTPNIQNAIRGQGRMYGPLSEIAHFSYFNVHGLLGAKPNSTYKAVHVFSQYSENSLNCMNLRLYLGINFTRWMALRLPVWYPRKNFDTLQKSIRVVFALALNAGLIHEEKK